MFKRPPPKQKSQIQIQRQGWFGFEKPAQFSALPSLISLNLLVAPVFGLGKCQF